jgi:hypothetical protein
MAQKDVVVYTAVFNDYDVLLKPQNVPDHVDFVCFTDDPAIATGPWEARELTGAEPPRTQTARAKMLPHEYFPEYDYSVWVDGNLGIVGDVTELIDEAGSGIVSFDHPRRDCIYDEAERCIEKGLADPDAVAEQMARYRDEGFPESYGLSDVALLVRRHHDPEVKAAMETWWEAYRRGSTRSQLCFEYALWKHDYDPDRLAMEFTLENSPYFRKFGHKPPGIRGRIHEVRLRALERADRTPYFLLYVLASVPTYVGKARWVIRHEGAATFVRKALEQLIEWGTTPRR